MTVHFKNISTWRERIGQAADFPLHVPTDVERAMVAEIAELRAAAFFNVPAAPEFRPLDNFSSDEVRNTEVRKSIADPYKKDDDEGVALVLEMMGKAGIATMTHEQRCSFLSAMMLASYQLMRSMDGDEFVRGFFEAALADMANPSPVKFRATH